MLAGQGAVTLDSSAPARSAGYSNTELAGRHLVSGSARSLHGLILHSDQRTWDLFSHLERTLREGPRPHRGAPRGQDGQPGDPVVSAETPPTQGQGRGGGHPDGSAHPRDRGAARFGRSRGLTQDAQAWPGLLILRARPVLLAGTEWAARALRRPAAPEFPIEGQSAGP